MKPHAQRLGNLQYLIDTRFGGVAGRFADFMEKNRPSIYRLLNTETHVDSRNVGEGFAREIEDKFGLERGWMDADHSADIQKGVNPVPEPITNHDEAELPVTGVQLTYATAVELSVLTSLRQATKIGRDAIILAAKNAPKDAEKLPKKDKKKAA